MTALARTSCAAWCQGNPLLCMETGRKFYWTRHRRSIWDPFLAALVRCGSAPAELCLGAPGKGEGAGRKANAPPSQAFPVHINIFLDSGSCGYHHARALSWPIDQRQGLRSVDGAKDYQHFRRYPKRGTWSARVDWNNRHCNWRQIPRSSS